MKLLIPSYGRAGRVTTPAALDVNADIIIGVHSDADYESYVTAQPELESFLVVTYASTGPLGANAQRAVLARNFLDDGEWACFADDNITALVGVSNEE